MVAENGQAYMDSLSKERQIVVKADADFYLQKIHEYQTILAKEITAKNPLSFLDSWSTTMPVAPIRQEWDDPSLRYPLGCWICLNRAILP